MARIIVEKNPYNIKLPGQIGNIIKTMETEFEPPKDYLWLTPLGELFVYYCCDWEHIDDFLSHPYHECDMPVPDTSGVDEKLKKFEQEVMAKVAEYVAEHSGLDIEIENRLAALENIDHSIFVTADDA